MDIKHQSIILDVNKANILPNIIAHQGDQKTRFIDVTLTMSGEELILNDSYRAILKASNNGEVKAINDCEIDLEQNIIIVELTSTMLDTAGFLNCEITVVDEDKYITSQNFMVEVSLSTVSDEDEIETSKEYGTLVRLMNEVSKIESDAKVVKDIISHLAEITDIDALVNSKADKETVEKELAKKADTTDLDTKENISNKIDTINFPSTTYYPSSKAVWDYVTSKLSALINDIENLKNNKANVTDFNTFKDTTNKTIANHSTNISTNANNIETMKADLDKKDKVIKNLTIKNTTEKSTGVVLNDSSDCNIVNLICDEKDDSNQIAFYRKNLFDFNSIRVYGNSSASNVVVNKNSKSISFTTSETSVNSGIYIRHTSYQDYKGYGVDYTKLDGKPVALSFDVQSDINCKIGIEFIKASYKYFDITSEKQRIVVTDTVDINKLNKALCFYTNKTKANITISNIQIEVNNTATDYEDCDYQKVTLTDADVNSLHTYYPSTTVISDSDCILTYVADNKNYIDNKILEVATALVASESEVM